MRSCQTTDNLLFEFVDGVETSLDDHVATCDECQGFLAELWEGELREDLSEPVMQRIKLGEFVADVARFGLDVAAAMGRAAVAYGPGADAEDNVENDTSASAEQEDTE